MRFIAILIAALCYTGVHGFIVAPAVQARTTTCTTGIGTTSSLTMTVLSYNGKKKDFKPGTPLSKAVAQLGVNVKYSCKKYVSVTWWLILHPALPPACLHEYHLLTFLSHTITTIGAIVRLVK